MRSALIFLGAEKFAEKFNRFRNYIGSQVSFMFINHLSSFPDGEKQIEGLVEKIVIKD